MPRPQLKKRADGRFRAKYKDQYFYGKTQTEAYKARDDYKELVKAGIDPSKQNVTLGEYAQTWVTVHKKHTANRTYNEYVRFVNLITAAMGNKRLVDIVSTDIKRLYNLRDGFSESEISHMALTVRGIFNQARADRIILFDPTFGVKPPPGAAGTHRAIEPWERALIHKMEGHRMHCGTMVMLYAGLRRGEALALDINRDVNFYNNTISVSQAIHFEGNKPIPGPTKTDAGDRVIPLLPILADCLKGKNGLLLANSKGDYLSETGFTRLWESYLYQMSVYLNGGIAKRWYGRTKETKGKKQPPWREVSLQTHDLRHSFCTMLFEMGVRKKVAMDWMGHADEEMINKIYTHLTRLYQARQNTTVKEGINAYLAEQEAEAILQISNMGVKMGVKALDAIQET